MPRDFVRFTLVSAEGVPDLVRALREFLRERPHKLKSDSVSIDVHVPAEGDHAKALKRFIRKELRLPAGAAEGRRVRVWEPAELPAVAWHQVEFAFQPAGYAGTEHDNRFDTSEACPKCGLGSRPVEPVVTDLKPNRKRALHQLLTGEWIVNDATRARFADEGLAGTAYLRLVAADTGRDLDGVRLLQPAGVAPRVHASAPLRQGRHCPCGADGWGPAPDCELRFVYAASALPAEVDFLETYEAIGRKGGGLLGGRRRLLISRRAYEVLRQVKARGLEFRPVEIAG